MCGFVGLKSIEVGKNLTLHNKLFYASNHIKHRGPDEYNIYDDRFNSIRFRRLSIQDISHGSQPFTSTCGRYVLFLNGEIYNHFELRKLYLWNKKFKSNSDAETLVELISLLGLERALVELNGMFAITLIDKYLGHTFLVRDRFGVKPFYYTKQMILWSMDQN